MTITIHSVLAGAYRGKAGSLLTHASADGGETALCKRVKNLTDIYEGIPQDVPPTCPVCAVRAAVDRAHAFVASSTPGYEHTCGVPGCGMLRHDEEHTGSDGVVP